MRYHFTRHNDDHGIDEFLICRPVGGRVVPSTYDEAVAHAILRVAVLERYKTSDLSGDEWRFGAALYIKQAGWEMISNYIDIENTAAFLYPELYGDFLKKKWPDEFFSQKIGAIVFSWKGFPIYSASHDKEPTSLLVAMGHAPLAWLQARDQGCDPGPLERLCCQPGCREPFVSIYRKKKDYDREGHATEPEFFDKETVAVRGFCRKHLRRGDCGLDDADSNYEVLKGPGPDGHEPDPKKVVESGLIVLE